MYFRCNVPMNERNRKDVNDGVSWHCPLCKGRKTIREGSFFSKSHLTLRQWFLLLFFWMDEEGVTKAAKHSDVSLVTAINVYQWLREVCSSRLIRDGPACLGGPGRIVQIDESCFRHKPKVSFIIIIIIITCDVFVFVASQRTSTCK